MGIACAQAEKAGADYIHVDVIDGQFAPNLTVGPGVVNDIRPHTNLPLDVHLMVVDPGELIAPFVRSGADILTVHFEACANPLALVNQIKDDGARAGIAINPDTPLEKISLLLDKLDRLLIMSVFPGFAGQKMIKETLLKLSEARQTIDRLELNLELAIDGGINPDNACETVKAGADVLAVGSAAFNRSRTIAESLSLFHDKLRVLSR